MRLVSSIQQLSETVIRVCQQRNHSSQRIPSEQEYSRDASPVKVIYNLHMVSQQALVKHPFEPNRSRAFVLRSAREPIEIINSIESLDDRRHVLSSIHNREDLSVGTHVVVAVQQRFEPTAS